MIVYFSNATGFTHKFVSKLGSEAQRIPIKTDEASRFEVDSDYILIVPTYGSKTQGFLPRQVSVFLKNVENRKRLRAVIGTGNINFGEDFAIAASIISVKAKVPLLYRFELAGTQEDVDNVRERVDKFWETS